MDLASRTREFDGQDLKLHVFGHLRDLDKQGFKADLKGRAHAYRCPHRESPCKELPSFASCQDLGHHILSYHQLGRLPTISNPASTLEASRLNGGGVSAPSQPVPNPIVVQSPAQVALGSGDGNSSSKRAPGSPALTRSQRARLATQQKQDNDDT